MNSFPVKVTPSLFAADFYNLSAAVSLMEKAGVDRIHYDVMDQHFVPNLSFGPKLIEDVCRKTDLPGDMHLMIELRNDDSLKPYLDLPAEHITLHYESCVENIDHYLSMILSAGKTAGLSIKPGTAVNLISPYLDKIQHVLIMSVEPGFSGQSFMPEAINRMRELKTLTQNRRLTLQIDGGIGRSNAKTVAEAGANDLVIGSAFFKDADPVAWVHEIHQYQTGTIE